MRLNRWARWQNYKRNQHYPDARKAIITVANYQPTCITTINDALAQRQQETRHAWLDGCARRYLWFPPKIAVVLSLGCANTCFFCGCSRAGGEPVYLVSPVTLFLMGPARPLFFALGVQSRFLRLTHHLFVIMKHDSRKREKIYTTPRFLLFFSFSLSLKLHARSKVFRAAFIETCSEHSPQDASSRLFFSFADRSTIADLRNGSGRNTKFIRV